MHPTAAARTHARLLFLPAIRAQAHQDHLLFLDLESRRDPRRAGMPVARDIEHLVAIAAEKVVVMPARQLEMRHRAGDGHLAYEPLLFKGLEHPVDGDDGGFRQRAERLGVDLRAGNRLRSAFENRTDGAALSGISNEGRHVGHL